MSAGWMTIEQFTDLEGLLHQFAKTQSQLQPFFGLSTLLLCVLQPDRPAKDNSAKDSSAKDNSVKETASPHPIALPDGLRQSALFRIVLLCPDWQAVMGWNVQGLKQQNWFDLVHPEDVFATQSQFRSLLHSLLPQPHCQFETRMCHADGSERRFSWRFVLGKDGLLYGSATQLQPEPLQPQPSAKLVQQRLEREQLLTTISQRIRQTLDLSKVLETTVEEVRDFLQSDRVVIFQFAPDWNGQVVVESVRPGCSSILSRKIYDPCFKHFWHEPYLEGRIHQIEDIDRADLHPCYRELLVQLNVRANLVVPILQNNLQPDLQNHAQLLPQQNRLWGLLIAHQCDASRQWQQEDVSLLIQLACQVAVAIQQSELYQQVSQLNTTLEFQVQQRTAQLQQAFEFEATLKRITDKVRDSLDEAQILQTAVRELTLAMGISSCDTGIYSHQHQLSTIAYEYIQGKVPVAQGRIVPIEGFPEYYQPLLRGEYLQFCWHNAIYVIGSPIRALANQFVVLACPIIDDQGVLGDLWLYKESDGVYEEQEIRLVQQVANQCAIAIRQARLYQAAQAQVIELERLNYLKDDFLSTISHELRTPVANIKMAAELLEIHLHQLQLLGEGTAIDRHFEILKQETHREINLIDDLLDLSRLDANTEPLLLTTIDPGSWIRYVAEPFIERAQRHQQTLELHIPDHPEGSASHRLPPLTTDLTDLERIVTELLDNACKYTPPHETIALSVSQLLDGPALQISVCNSGVEIPPNEQTRIFDKFYRIPNHDPWKYSGVGLGLALVKRLVQRLDATIQIKSGDRHTTFLLTVPLDLQATNA